MIKHCKSLSSDQLRKWVKGKVIGTGSHGSVHLAMNKANGSLFVVKSARSRDGIQYLQNEANILDGLDSYYIVRYLGRQVCKGSNEGGEFNVFLEYMASRCLSHVAENFGGSFEEEVICSYTKDVLLGLKYLHDQGIVHCDVKCKNMLLDSSGTVKLADFGCAKRIKDLNGYGNVANSRQSIGGTLLWMAPEVLRKEGVNFASDIWSLGCAVIEMATGRPPWTVQVSNPMAAVMKIAHGDDKPTFPVNFSEEGLDFLAKCLDRNPERRWTAQELLNHPFISQNLKNKFASSPVSVFGISKYETHYDSDIPETPDADEYSLFRNPFATRDFEERMRTVGELHEKSTDFDSSEDWITIRSIDDHIACTQIGRT